MPEIEASLLLITIIVIGSYVIGSVPFGLLVSRLFGLPDPREIGSKNIGATNVLRSGSKIAALMTVLLDAAKGTISVLIAIQIAGQAGGQAAALAAFLGHVFPVWLGFKGGKGVATLLGAILGLSPLVGILAFCVWLITFAALRYSSLSAVVAATATPLIAYITGHENMLVMLLVMALMLFWTHRANIGRLIAGNEPKINFGKK